MQDYLDIASESIGHEFEPLHGIARLMRAEADIFALALAVRLMVDDKDIEAEVMIELRHESELALTPAAISVAAEYIDIGGLVGFEKIALELVSFSFWRWHPSSRVSSSCALLLHRRQDSSPHQRVCRRAEEPPRRLLWLFQQHS